MKHMPRKPDPTDELVQSKACNLYAVTPLAMMLRGYQVAANQFALNNRAACYLTDAATAQARAMRHLSYRTAALWLEPFPISPISATTKIAQTQTLLMMHMQDLTKESILRFEALQNDSLAAWGLSTESRQSSPRI